MKSLPLIVLALTLAPATAFAASDPAFLTDAMKGDNSEVSIGKLAEQRATTPAARQYGAMLVQDHSAHRMKIVTLAQPMGVQPTMALSDDGMKARSTLRALHGSQFDAAFKQQMIDDHQQDIAKYQDQVKSAQSPKVRKLAQDTLPTLQKHLAAAQAL